MWSRLKLNCKGREKEDIVCLLPTDRRVCIWKYCLSQVLLMLFDGCDMLHWYKWCKLWKDKSTRIRFKIKPRTLQILEPWDAQQGAEASLHADNSQVVSLANYALSCKCVHNWSNSWANQLYVTDRTFLLNQSKLDCKEDPGKESGQLPGKFASVKELLLLCFTR